MTSTTIPHGHTSQEKAVVNKTQHLTTASWATRRDEKRNRIESVQPWMRGPILAPEKIVDALELLLKRGDRVVLEGDNQKQADFLSRSLVQVDPKKLQDLHLIISSISRPEHLTLFELGIAKKVDFSFDGVLIHAMHKEAAARITRRTVAQLDKLAETVTPLSDNVRDYAKLGLLYKLLHVSSAEHPNAEDVSLVRQEVIAAIQDARKASPDLSNRIESEAARVARGASRLVRARLEEQWNH